MNELMIFEGKQVEVFEFDGKVLFNPYDVAECLDIKNVKDNVSNMNDKQVVKLTNSKVGNTDFRKLHNTGENFLTESGVYKLIFKSHKKDAEKFQDWVTDEVLPSIRKHGAYMTPDKIEEVLLSPDTIIKLATDLKAEREKRKTLELESKKKDQLIGELKPKADYTDRILQSKSLVNANQIAKDYGMSATSFNKLLFKLGVQYKQSEQWLLYRRHQKKGYTSSETFEFSRSNGTIDVNMRTKWTQKGRLFLYEILKKNDILPLIEQAEKTA